MNLDFMNGKILKREFHIPIRLTDSVPHLAMGASSLERVPALARWRRARFPRLLSQRPAPSSPSTALSRTSTLLRVRSNSLMIHRRKSSVFNRVFHGRSSFHQQLRSAASAAAGFDPLPVPVPLVATAAATTTTTTTTTTSTGVDIGENR